MNTLVANVPRVRAERRATFRLRRVGVLFGLFFLVAMGGAPLHAQNPAYEWVKIPCTTDPNWNDPSYPYYDLNQTVTDPDGYRVKSKLLKWTVKFDVERIEDAQGNVKSQRIGVWYTLENTLYPNEEFDIIVCGMLQFMNPDPNAEKCPHTKYTVEKVVSGSTCEWKCTEIGPSVPMGNTFSYHYGCQKVHIGKPNDPDGKIWVYDGWTEVNPTEICGSTPVKLGKKGETGNGVWPMTTFYVDLAMVTDDNSSTDDCTLDIECETAGPNLEFQLLLQGTELADCSFGNAWVAPTGKAKRGNDPVPTTSTLIDVGNWVTMAYPDNYAAHLQGRLAGARTGTTFSVIHPKDTLGTDTTILYDTTSVVVGTLSGCNGDTTTVSVDFMITPYPNQIMVFQLTPPNNTCGNNIPNGRRIEFAGTVSSRDGAGIYDTNQSMYGIYADWLRDTTAPTIGSINTTVIDPQTLALEVITGEDVSMVDGSWIQYSWDGDDSVRCHFLAYEDNLAVDDSTVFRDTLGLPFDSLTLYFEAVARNELGLRTVSATDTCIIYGIATDVPAVSADRAATLHPNPTTGIVRLPRLPQDPESISLLLYDSRGSQAMTFPVRSGTSGDDYHEFDLSGLPNGVWWYVVEGRETQNSGRILIQR